MASHADRQTRTGIFYPHATLLRIARRSSVRLLQVGVTIAFLYWFLPRDAVLSAVYAVVVCLCVSLCPSHSGIVSKRLNVGSRK